MTDLRKELNVTDTEHGELLLKINSDKSLKMIREWRKSAPCVQGSLVGELNASGSAPNPTDYALQKKRKTSYSSDSIFHKQELHGQASPVVHPFAILAPSDDKGRGIVQPETKIGYNTAPYFDHLRKGSDVIVICETKNFLHEIERVIYGREGTVPAQVERAMLMLKDHERSLLYTLAKLSDVSDDVSDDSPDQMLHHYSHGEVENKRQITTHSDCHGQAGGLHSYPPKRYLPKKCHPAKSYDPTLPVKPKVPRP
ncbi:protein EMSY-LIKE 3-like isoform X3 [Durio zibethinus]|nr:protein EMSY-LIKE 3-like isoform X3 [Durio zibethinus]